jgi:hypothetical protein
MQTRVAGSSSVEEDFEFGLLHPGFLLGIWDEVERILEEHPPKAGGELFATPTDIKMSILDTSAFIWGGFQDGRLELIMLCCFRKYPITRTLEVLYVGGKGLKRAFRRWPLVEEWAAKCGATHIEARMSRAMLRFYSSMEIKETAVYFRKPLVQFSN